jgi:hypothetical protein
MVKRSTRTTIAPRGACAASDKTSRFVHDGRSEMSNARTTGQGVGLAWNRRQDGQAQANKD